MVVRRNDAHNYYGHREFGIWLRHQREILGLTQEELASRVACTRESISKIELGSRKPSKQITLLLAAALGIPDEARAAFGQFARKGVKTAVPGGSGSSAPIRLDGAPPVQHSGARLTNIPGPLTTFVGRTHEMAAIRAHLLQPSVPLLTLVGTAGVGKTRLALELGRSLIPLFADGVFVVRLADIADPEMVPSAVVQTLGLRESVGHNALATLVAGLEARTALLILDNFEHVVDSALFISRLLEQCPQVKVLATSRERLRLHAEHVFDVQPLPVPTFEQVRSATARSLLRSPAVQLFVDRSKAADFGFNFSTHNMAAVAELCRQFDGLPLALELVAARSRDVPLQEMLSNLGNTLDLTSEGAQDLPARHRALREAIGWSYTRLDRSEQRMFGELSVFAGGATMEAIQAVCTPTDRREGRTRTKALVIALAEKHLLYREAGPGIEPRFSMLFTVRHYAAERLEAEGRAGRVRLRHCRYYMDLAEAANSHMHGQDQHIWLEMLGREVGNFRSALRWTVDHGYKDIAQRICIGLLYFWSIRGYHRESLSWIEEVLDMDAAPPVGKGAGREQQSPHASDLDTARLILGKAIRLGLENRYREAAELCRECLHTFQAHGDKLWTAEAWLELGLNAARQGEYDLATASYLNSLDLYTEIGYLQGMATTLGNLGGLARLQHDYARAIDFYERGLRVHERGGNERGEYICLVNLSDVCIILGEDSRAVELLSAALPLIRVSGEKYWLVACLCQWARLATRQGGMVRAARLLGKIEALCSEAQIGLGPIANEARERSLEQVKSHLDEVTLEATWEEGRLMDTDRVIKHALTAK